MRLEDNKHNYYYSTASYRGNIHKDIIYRDKSHKALYKGKELMWRRVVVAYHYGLIISSFSGKTIRGVQYVNEGGGIESFPSSIFQTVYGELKEDNYDEIGCFCIVEDCSLKDILLSFDKCEVKLSGPSNIYDGEVGEQARPVASNSYKWYFNAKGAFNVPSSKPNGKVQFYFYLAKRRHNNDSGSYMELSYLARVGTKNNNLNLYCGAGWGDMTMDENDIITAINPDSGGVVSAVRPLTKHGVVFDSTDVPFCTDFFAESATHYKNDGTQTARTIRTVHYLPKGTINALIEKGEI